MKPKFEEILKEAEKAESSAEMVLILKKNLAEFELSQLRDEQERKKIQDRSSVRGADMEKLREAITRSESATVPPELGLATTPSSSPKEPMTNPEQSDSARDPVGSSLAPTGIRNLFPEASGYAPPPALEFASSPPSSSLAGSIFNQPETTTMTTASAIPAGPLTSPSALPTGPTTAIPANFVAHGFRGTIPGSSITAIGRPRVLRESLTAISPPTVLREPVGKRIAGHIVDNDISSSRRRHD